MKYSLIVWRDSVVNLVLQTSLLKQLKEQGFGFSQIFYLWF